jgi:HK97 family phage prohead protease
MNEIERRAFEVEELRMVEGDEPEIMGYAAVFNAASEDLGGFTEKIQRGAFTKSLLGDDIRALFNHDPNYVLGRNRSGTLNLEEDEQGLRIRVKVPNTQWARDLVESIRRGDISQMSFAFRTIKDEWEKVENKTIRTLKEVKLFDVSPVTYPAYPQTSAAVRSAYESFTAESQVADDRANEEARSQVRLANRKRKLEILEKF